MNFKQLTIKVTNTNVDIVSEILAGMGSISISYSDNCNDAIYEPPLGETPMWNETKINALFEPKKDIEHIQKMLLQICNIEKSYYTILSDRVWEDECKKDFTAMQFGKCLWICPSWEDHLLLPKDAIIIDMDPGLAFGTGTHETTRLCLEYLDNNPPKDLSVIDYGSGTGVLAIGAAKLGAHHVTAIDNDPQAIIATNSNVNRNNLADIINVVHSSEESTIAKADLIIANILANPLIDLCEHFVSLLKVRGKLVLSGIIEDQIDIVMQAYGKYFESLTVSKKGTWCRVDGIKL